MTTPDAKRAAGAPLLAACTAAVSEFLDERVDALLKAAHQGLLAAAEHAEGPDDEERLLSAMEQVDALGPRVKEGFTAAVLAKLQEPESTGGRAEDDPDAGLALVETAKVDDWLRLRDLLGRHPAEAQALETQMWQRLAATVGASTHPDDNPLSLQGMVMMFQEVLKAAAPARDARVAIYDAFETELARRLSVLAARIEVLSDEVGQQPGGGDSAAAGQDQGEEAREAAGGDGGTGAGAQAAAADAPPEQSDEAPPEPVAVAGQSPGDDAEPVAAAGGAEPAAGGAVEPGTGDMPAPPAAGAGEAAPGRPEDAVRLVGALAKARRDHDPEAFAGAPLTAGELAGRLEAAVVPPGVSLDDDERRAVTALAGIVEQTLAHPDVDPALARQLWRLAPPLLMLVLQGEEYLETELTGARHDAVTGLLDRESFRAALEQATRSGLAGHAVCLLEVGGIDRIRSQAGSQVGSRVLRALGELLRTHAGSTAAASRLRGEEFAVLLRATDPAAGRRLAGRLLDAIAQARFMVGGEPVDMEVSIGVVEADPRLATPAAVMGAVDAARQQAVAAGGNCLRVHDPDGDAGA